MGLRGWKFLSNSLSSPCSDTEQYPGSSHGCIETLYLVWAVETGWFVLKRNGVWALHRQTGHDVTVTSKQRKLVSSQERSLGYDNRANPLAVETLSWQWEVCVPHGVQVGSAFVSLSSGSLGCLGTVGSLRGHPLRPLSACSVQILQMVTEDHEASSYSPWSQIPPSSMHTYVVCKYRAVRGLFPKHFITACSLVATVHDWEGRWFKPRCNHTKIMQLLDPWARPLTPRCSRGGGSA